MSESRRLSVVIPVYNEASWIGPTLDWLLAYLRSRGKFFEVLVVDDGWTNCRGRRAS